MDTETRKWIWVVLGLLTLGAMLIGGIIFVVFGLPSKPTITLNTPASGTQLKEGQTISVKSTATDANGVVRVELAVDNVMTHVENVPVPQKSFIVEQTWKAAAGEHTLSVRAYNAHGGVSEPASVRVNVSPANPTPTLVAPTAIPTPTSTPPPGPCVNDAAFIADITVPDGTPVTPGQAFNKIWRMQNTGTCPWNENYKLVFAGGQVMSANSAVAVPFTMPGATADLVVPMTAPTTTGPHAGRWQLRGENGAFFGALLDARINVLVPQPPPACSGKPQISSFTASATLVAPHTLITLNWGLASNATGVKIDPGIGQVATPGSFQVVVDNTTTFVLTAYCDTNQSTAMITVYVQATPPTPTPIPPTPKPALRVTGATASVSPANWTGPCPGTFTYSGNITINDAGTITYRWSGSSSTSPSPVMTFYAPSAGAFTLPGYQAPGGAKGGQWAQLIILSPNQLTSNQAQFTNSCNDPKPAPPVAEILEPQNNFVGSTLAPVHIVFRGRDANDMKSITLYGNGVQLARQASPGHTSEIIGYFDWHPVPGRVELYVIAEDWDGQTTRSATIIGEIKPPAPAPTPVPPTPLPPTAAPGRRNINGTWVAGEYELELSEAIGCTTDCGIAGRLIKAVLPAPEIHDVRGAFRPTTGTVTWTIQLPGGQTFNGTVSADSRTMSGTLGNASLVFTKK